MNPQDNHAEGGIAALDSPCVPKKILTQQVVRDTLAGQKARVSDYIKVILGLGIAILLGTFVFALFYLFIVNCLLELWKMFKRNRNRKNLDHYVLVRSCNEKEFVVDDEDPDVYKLWFPNLDGQLNVCICVTQAEYDATEVGDVFLLVFVPNEIAPCLWYRGSEWELDRQSWQSS